MDHYSKNKTKWLTGLLLFTVLSTQPATAQLSYRAGAEIEPGYEGWRANEDGTYSLILGYMNENWEEQPNGEYILWARGDDGGLYRDQYITVNISP